MHDQAMERATFAARHDFDILPRSAEIEVQPARRSDLPTLADMGNRLVPGVQIAEPDLERYFAYDPESILTFRRNQKLLGAVAFIYFDSKGHEALLSDDIDLERPDLGLLADQSGEVAAIYVWAIVGKGRAMAGLGNVSTFLSQKRFLSANIYAHAASADGLNLMDALGFEPIPCSQKELWRYERPWNRSLPTMSRSGFSVASFADARH
jgi:hypothetical protein